MSTYLSIDSGDTETLTIAVTDPDTGGAVNLTGATLTFLVKAAAGDADAAAVITKTTAAGITITDPPTAGLATIAIAPADTAALAGRYAWGLQAIDSTGAVTTLAQGMLTIRADLVEG